MSLLRSHDSTRHSLRADAAISGAFGLLLIIAQVPLGELFGLPTALLFWAGAFCVAWAAVLARLARRPSLTSGAMRAVVILNLLWVVDSVILLETGWVTPTALGVAFVLAQAATVAGIAAWQWSGLRRIAAPA